MDKQKIQKKIKEITDEFLKKTTFETEVEILFLKSSEKLVETSQKDNIFFINLKTKEPQILIGEKGETLLEIQHLLRVILRKQINVEELFYIDLDINEYKKKKAIYLKEIVREIVEEVVLTKKEKILPPMSSYERRIIHLELSGYPNITTESIGQEPERRIVIKFLN